MDIIETKLPGVVIIQPKVFGDSRGFFKETWNTRKFTDAGLDLDFVQDNVSFSQKGVLRGLHYQNPNPQGKLVQALLGEVYDVAVDIRPDSETFGQYVGEILSAENHRQLYIPPGFAHGFCVISDTALFAYKCTDIYNARAEGGIIWNDPDLAIDWPIKNPSLSDKDKQYTPLAQIPKEKLPPRGVLL